jgi:hypothetical protein
MNGTTFTESDMVVSSFPGTQIVMVPVYAPAGLLVAFQGECAKSMTGDLPTRRIVGCA